MSNESDLDATYTDGRAKRRLLLQKCSDCNTWRFPAAPLCSHCLGTKFEWRETSGKGHVWSWIRMHRKYFGDFHREVPYNIVFVELEEGPMMISAVTGEEPVELRVGAPAELAFRDGGGVPQAWFTLIQDGEVQTA